MTVPVLGQLRGCGATIIAGPEPGTLQLALRGPLPPALRAAVRDRAGLRRALDQEAADAAVMIRDRRTARRVLRHAAALLGDLPPDALETRWGRRRGRRRARLVADPSRALYWALSSAAGADGAEAAARVAELVHGAVRQELEVRCPGQLVEGGLVRVGDAEGPGALRELFRAAADRLRPPEADS